MSPCSMPVALLPPGAAPAQRSARRPAPGAAVRRRVLRLPADARARSTTRRARPSPFQHARAPDLDRAGAGLFIEPTCSLGPAPAGVDRLRQLDVRQRADHDLASAALIFLYLFHNEQLLLRAEHVHGRHGASRSSATPLFPTAPPRFFPEWGFLDTVSDFTGVEPRRVTVNALFNPYAAVPSMHVLLRADDRRSRWRRCAKHRVTHRLGDLPAARDLRRSSRPATTSCSTRSSAPSTAALRAYAAEWLAPQRPTPGPSRPPRPRPRTALRQWPCRRASRRAPRARAQPR